MKILNNRSLFYYYLATLILISVLPINGTDSSLNNNYVFSFRLDYIAHFTVLLPYFFLLNKKIRSLKTILKFLTLALIFASFVEAIQFLVPYRSYNINDMAANWIGILLSFVFFLLYSKKKMVV